MKNMKLVSFVIVLLIVSISCSLFTPDSSNDVGNAPNDTTNLPVIDFEAPAEPLNVIVQLDEAFTASGEFTARGGVMTLTAGDGAVFTL